jgi:competence protein ComGC
MVAGIAVLLVISLIFLVFIRQWIRETKEAKEFNAQDNFQMYREKYPNKVLEDGTVICKHCGSHKTVMHRGNKYCQTCNGFIYRTGTMKAFSIGI